MGLLTSPAVAQEIPANFSSDERRALVEQTLHEIRTGYFDTTAAARIDRALRARLDAGAYVALTDPAAFADSVTAHIQAVHRDAHLGLGFSIEPLPDYAAPTSEEEAQYEDRIRRWNYGFERVEILPGNVGYLNLRMFADADTEGAGSAAVAALQFLANTDALIIDLRQNRGGGPGMLELLATYLLDEPAHLQTLHWRQTWDGRPDVADQTWTLSYVPGRRLTTQPLYLLTSARTFSAAEAFVYALQTRRRATVVGETTGGGANIGGRKRLSDHFYVWVPTGTSISPITGTNWDGVGITPDISAIASEALTIAHGTALQALLEAAHDDDDRTRELARFIADLEASQRP